MKKGTENKLVSRNS